MICYWSDAHSLIVLDQILAGVRDDEIVTLLLEPLLLLDGLLAIEVDLIRLFIRINESSVQEPAN